ncbi:hypothetical protein D3C72_1584760 [compost metagenome]
MREDLDAEFGQQHSRQGTDRHARRRLPCARTLEHVPNVLVTVLSRSGIVGMAGADLGDALARDGLEPGRVLGIQGFGGHGQLPVREVLVLDLKRDGSARGEAVAHARAKRHAVRLDLHALAAPVALLAARQFGVDRCRRQGHARREAFDDRELHGAVGLACR